MTGSDGGDRTANRGWGGLAGELALGLVLTLTVFGGLHYVLVSQLTRSTAEERIRNHMAEMSGTLMLTGRVAVEQGSQVALDRFVRRAADLQPVDDLAVLGANGMVRAHRMPALAGRPLHRPDLPALQATIDQVARSGVEAFRAVRDTSGRRCWIAVGPLPAGTLTGASHHDRVPLLVAVLRADRTEEAVAGQLWWGAVLDFALVSAVILVLWQLLRRRVIRPLQALERAIPDLEAVDGAGSDTLQGVGFRCPDGMPGNGIGRLAHSLERGFETVRQAALQQNELLVELAQANEVMESQMVRAQSMVVTAEVASNAKSEFLANMSHEVRTPMTAILGYAELLAESEIEAGRMDVERLAVCPRQVLQDCVDLMRARADGKGLGLQLEVAEDVPPWVESDPTRIRQIALNLIGNAVKFTEVGGVTVRVSWAADALQVAVTDTGIGMDRTQLGRVFEEFSQADASTSRKHGGTGLGLAISRKLARLLGGDIAVASSPGKGSRFVVSLAAVPCDPPVPTGPKASAVSCGCCWRRTARTTSGSSATCCAGRATRW